MCCSASEMSTCQGSCIVFKLKCHGNTWKAWNKQICGGKHSRRWECIHHCVLRLTALTKRPTTATATTRSQPLSRHVTFCDIHYTEYFSYCMGFRVGQTLCSMRISTVRRHWSQRSVGFSSSDQRHALFSAVCGPSKAQSIRVDDPGWLGSDERARAVLEFVKETWRGARFWAGLFGISLVTWSMQRVSFLRLTAESSSVLDEEEATVLSD
jgi:hypothetical protein